MAMWCDGSLRRFDVPPLSFDESVRFIEAELGAPASREAAEALWSLSGGNPRSLRAAVHGLVRRHLLVRNNSFWVLLPGRLVLGRELTEAASPLLTASRPRRRIVQLIALAGYLPWAMLLEHFDAEDLDALQECSLIEVDHGPSPVARCSSTAMADAIAETVPAEEACALYRQFCGFEGARAVLDDEPARHAFWLLRSGMPLPTGSLSPVRRPRTTGAGTPAPH
jgi:hypothetical protein